jgi:hypothetical protein
LRRKAQDWRQKRQILRGGEVEQTRTPQPLWIDMKLYEIMMLYEIRILYQFISIMIWVDMNWNEWSAVWTWHCSSRAKWICWESLEFVCHFFARGCHLHKTWSLAYWACYSNCSRKPPNIVSDKNSR